MLLAKGRKLFRNNYISFEITEIFQFENQCFKSIFKKMFFEYVINYHY